MLTRFTIRCARRAGFALLGAATLAWLLVALRVRVDLVMKAAGIGRVKLMA